MEIIGKKCLICLFAVTLLVSLVISGCSSANDTKALAQCLSEKGVKMYGASWCGHCQNQKAMFGADAALLPYVECAASGGGQTEACAKEKITGYPTWKFPDGQTLAGEISLESLKEMSGC